METGRIEGMRELSALVAFVFVLFCAGTTVAMPSQKELSEAQPIVNELMGPFAKDYKAKKKTAAEVGDRAMEFVAEANTQAAKFVLLKGAVHYYALAKEYDKAADAIESIMKLVPDLPPKALYEITSKAVSSVTAKTAPRLFDLNKSAKDRMTVATRLKAIEKDLRSTPADLKLVRMHAELTAAAGNWEDALVEFAKLGGEIGQMAKAESEATATSAELADFWWNYKPMAAEAKNAIRVRAVSLYRKAIDKGELDGLKKSVAEKRIAETESTTANDSVADKDNSGYGSRMTNAKFKAGLVGYWSFDGNAKDSSGKRNNGIVHGVVPTEDRFGKADKAYRFNRGNYIEVPNSPTLQKITKAVTISAWVKPHQWDNGFMPIMQKGNQRERQFRLVSGRGKCHCGIGEICESRDWELGVWVHSALTYEYGKDVRIYQNGELIGVSKADMELQANSLPLLIGCDPWGGMEYLIGDMDDVRVYNRALSEQEIKELYEAESASSK